MAYSKSKGDYFYFLNNYIDKNFAFKGEYEYLFHNKRRWRLDYSIPNMKVGFEVHGGVWSRDKLGRHSRGMGMKNDFEKLNAALLMNWIIFYFVTQKDLSFVIYDFFIKNEGFFIKRIEQ